MKAYWAYVVDCPVDTVSKALVADAVQFQQWNWSITFFNETVNQELCNLKNLIDSIINAFSSTPDKALDI